jgi:hypothetical protein
MEKQDLVLGEIYRDNILGLCLYMGRLGFEFNTDMTGRKGKYTFRILDQKKPCFFVLFSEKELKDLKSIYK